MFLEKYDIGTGAVRRSTYAELSFVDNILFNSSSSFFEFFKRIDFPEILTKVELQELQELAKRLNGL